ncbi:MAG: YceI family protein [Flavobacteriales bacterium]|nr:YceI family protein [Flavobacteriales bacterium]MCX7769190.1 YceI family protein [Flavobacteriales bacterium]MDW8410706.1 YceI family protein [Flavobacteriales bacterium]
MKQFHLFVLSFLSAFTWNCGEKKATVETAAEQAPAQGGNVSYAVVTDSSTFQWFATKITGAGHNGTFALKEGTLSMEQGIVKSGKFVADLSLIKVVDLTDPEMNAKLLNHLKSPDFFDVEKFPTATFEITGTEKLNNDSVKVSGNLTIKDITKNITFPAVITTQGDEVNVKADFYIDRTEWGIKYNSGKFFKNLGDKLIKDEINFKIQLKARKSAA